ncbi:transcriptional regulator [Actinoallomurus sp. CA-142502]|uniref:transcriptional regulator n=1 Tax=Actinoallomurus sp. CA-142502 TaxID=3239885 RepID=UPI003D938FA5
MSGSGQWKASSTPERVSRQTINAIEQGRASARDPPGPCFGGTVEEVLHADDEDSFRESRRR